MRPAWSWVMVVTISSSASVASRRRSSWSATWPGVPSGQRMPERHPEDFQACKGLAALDERQVRCWTPWYRWVTLAMLAQAFLTIAALAEHT
jgi:hypothetical protein